MHAFSIKDQEHVLNLEHHDLRISYTILLGWKVSTFAAVDKQLFGLHINFVSIPKGGKLLDYNIFYSFVPLI